MVGKLKEYSSYLVYKDKEGKYRPTLGARMLYITALAVTGFYLSQQDFHPKIHKDRAPSEIENIISEEN